MKTLKERYQDLKAKYEAYSNLSEFTISGHYQYLDKYRRTGKWSDIISTNLDREANDILADFINANSGVLLTKIKAKALTSYNAAKTAYNDAVNSFNDAIANDTEIAEAKGKAMLSFMDVQNDLTPLKDLTEVAVSSDDMQIRIVNGFNSLNRLFVEVLNDNLDLVKQKFPEFVEARFNAEVALLDAEVQEYKDERLKV